MNKKRKVLTIAALLAFSVIIALHYGWCLCYYRGDPAYLGWCGGPIIDDVRMPLFVLGVFYVGMFAILGDSKQKEQ